jgi:hypothetical protein
MAQPHHGIEDKSKPAVVVLEVEPVVEPALVLPPVAVPPPEAAPEELIML